MQRKVLAVDDSPMMRDILQSVLETGRMYVRLAANGAEAMEIFSQTQFDLVITDINMPVMDGLTLIKKIREVNPAIPILVLTTVIDPHCLEQGTQLGANGWINKPLEESSFLALIRGIFN